MPNNYLPKILHNGELIDFEGKKLLKNIEDETGLKREDSLKIVEEVVRQFVSSHNIDPLSEPKHLIITKPMIREKTCSVMVDLEYLEARKKYTRIGMSMHEAKAIFEVDYPIESKMRQVYEHMEKEFEGVKELRYDE